MTQIEKITSRENGRLIQARKVRDGRIARQIFIEGRRLAAEALASGVVLDDCFVIEGFRDPDLVKAVAEQGTPIAEVRENLFRSISDTEQSQGIILIGQRQKTGVEKIEIGLSKALLPLVIYLKEISNPSNLGAIVRTAAAAGVAGIIISKNSADMFSPKALRSAMGATFKLPVWSGAHFDEVVEWAQDHHLIPTAAATRAKLSYRDIDWSLPRLLVFGSEAHGLDQTELDRIDEPVAIPLQNGVESLNLAVSAGVLLYEAVRSTAKN